MAVYSITNQKGGVGKSTTCASLGTALTEKGKKVLLVDLDPQAGLTTVLGFNPDSFETTIYNALLYPEKQIIKEIIKKTKVDNLYFTPSNLDLSGAEGELLGEIGWDRNLKEALSPILNDFDFVLIDCPPSLGVLTTNALMAAERVIIPVQTEYLSFRSLKQLNSIISKVKAKGNPALKEKVLRTMHNTRTIHSRETSEELEKLFKGKIYKTLVKRTIKFADSALAGEPILVFARKSDGALAYRELAEEIIHEQKTNH